MDSGDRNIRNFSSYIAAAGDTFFHPLFFPPSSPSLPISPSHLPPFFNSSLTTPTAPPKLNPTSAAPRISKKRPRPSQRAPTTVLATDASNFRAMVQIFTGIPSPPSSSSLNFSSPLLLHPFYPKIETPDSIFPNGESPINTPQISSSLFRSTVPAFASPEDFSPEKLGVVRGAGVLVSMAGSEEVEQDLGGEMGLAGVRLGCRRGTLDSWICSSD